MRTTNLWSNILLALGYIALALMVEFFFPPPAPVWPSTGIAVFAALVGGWRWMPGIAIGALVTNLNLGIGGALASMVGNVLAPMIGRSLFLRMASAHTSPFATPRNVGAFVLAMAGLNGMISGSFGAAGVSLIDAHRADDGFWVVFLNWASSDAASAMMLAPAIYLWRENPHLDFPARGWTETLSATGLLIGVAIVLFLVAPGSPNWQQDGVVLLLLPMTWVTLRFTQRDAYTMLALTFLVMVAGTALHRDSFLPSSDLAFPYASLQLAIAVMGAMVLMASTLDLDRLRAIRALQEVNDSLEARVRERTRAIESSHQDLDITVRALRRLQAMYRALMFEGNALLRSCDEHDMLAKTCEAMVQDRQFHVVWIGRPGPSQRFEILALDGVGAEHVRQSPPRLGDGPEQSIVVRAWNAEKIVVCNDLLADAGLRPWHDGFAAHGWASLLAAPVRRGGVVWAVTAFIAAERQSFDDQTIELCQRVADLLGHGLDELDLRQRLVEQQRSEAYRARHDSLTGLPNRFALEQDVPQAIASATRSGQLLAVGMIDLDDFKPVNDAFGHDAGDDLLRQIAQRLQSHLNDFDMLVRLGGDEFVVILKDVDPDLFPAQLKTTMDRLHRAVETPFDLGEQDGKPRRAMVDMTAGLALYPNDGENLDALLRKADAAMYQAKANKVDRATWWTLDAALVSPLAPPNGVSWDAYGAPAAELLSRYRAQWEETTERFVAEWYADMAAHPGMRAILDTLTPEQFSRLRSRQAQHLRFLLDPRTTPSAIAQVAAHLGQVHALSGVTPDMLLTMTIDYQYRIAEHWDRTVLRHDVRNRLLQTLQVRLGDDIREQVRAHTETIEVLLASSLLPDLPNAEVSWAQVVRNELAALVRRPGLVAIALWQPDAQGVMQVTEGDAAPALLPALQLPDAELPVLDERSPLSQGIVARAWRSGTIHASGAVWRDPELQPWRAQHAALGARSMAAVPVRDSTGRPWAVLHLVGAHPNQFDSPWSQALLRGLQSRWQMLAGRRQFGARMALPLHQAQQRRAAILSGGLQMWMQPVVDLRTGHLHKVEALARLVAPGGEIVPPSGFLPLLGEAELGMLFEGGLRQSLGALRGWREQGLTPGLAINLSPSLLDAETLPQRIGQLLREADIAPERLTLELLETETLLEPSRQEAAVRLRDMGVNLAIDDLGSGHSSLQLLRKLPINVLKIDQGMVLGMRRDPLRALPLVASLVQMGRDLDLDVVLEGLETPDLIDVAQVLGAPLGQGFGLARPMPAGDVPAWAARTAPVRKPGPYTALGALTHHWLAIHRNLGSCTDVHTCPLTAFFERHGLADSPVAKAHADCHADIDRGDNSRDLLHALHELIRAQEEAE